MTASRLAFLVDAPPPPPAVRAPRRRPRVAVVAVVGLLVLLAAAVVWWQRPARVAAQVQWLPVPGGVQCASGTVVEEPGTDPGEWPVPVLAVEPGEGCTVELALVNAGDDAVELGRLTVHQHGPSTGGAARVRFVSPFGEVRAAEDTGVDGVVDLGTSLEPGAPLVLRLHFVHQPDGCTGAGNVSLGQPSVEVRTAGRTVDVAPAVRLFGVTGTAASDCSP